MHTILLAVLLGQPASAGDDVRHHVNQAKLFIRKGWHEDAAAELAAALDNPDGQTFEIYELAGQVAWDLHDIDLAIAMAEGAARVAPTEQQSAAAQRLADSYRQQFGFVTVDGPHPGMTSRLQLESTGLILDPELVTFINDSALTLRERTALPVRIGLPAGSYLINGESVSVSPAGEAALSLPMGAVGSRGFAALQVTRLELAAGGSVFLGDAADSLLPGPLAQLSLTQPVGPVLVGLLGEVSAASFTDAQNRMVSGAPSWGVGGRIGRELYLAGAVSVRPSLLARYSNLTGMTLASGLVDPDPTPATAIGGELAVEYREAGRTTALGTGVKLTADRTWGELSDGTPLSLVGLRMLANLSIAF